MTLDTKGEEVVLSLTCPDRPGIVRAVSSYILEQGGDHRGESAVREVVYYGAQNCGALAEELDPNGVDISNFALPDDHTLSDCQAPVEVEPSCVAYDESVSDPTRPSPWSPF